MKAIAVPPGTPNSTHLREIEKQSVADVPGSRGRPARRGPARARSGSTAA
jgi:hypothetical protein